MCKLDDLAGLAVAAVLEVLAVADRKHPAGRRTPVAAIAAADIHSAERSPAVGSAHSCSHFAEVAAGRPLPACVFGGFVRRVLLH